MLTKEISEVEKEIKRYKQEEINEITEVTKDGIKVFFKINEEGLKWFRNRAKLSTLKSCQAKFDKFVYDLKEQFIILAHCEEEESKYLKIIDNLSNKLKLEVERI
jgi:hypothetical protein